MFYRWQLLIFYCLPTICLLLPLFQGFPETVGVVISSVVAEPAVAVAAEPVIAVAAEAVSEVFESVVAVAAAVVSVVDPGISGPLVVFVALVSVSDVAAPRAFGYIAPAFDVLVPVSVVSVGVYSSRCPRFFAFPNIYFYSSSSSSFEVAGEESVRSSSGVRTSYCLCSILSNSDLHQNRKSGHCYNKPNPGYNNTTDTNDLPMDATTSHSRKICLRL
jgi:hypothetical protein